MTAPAYQTRAEAEGPPRHLVETLCETLYESTRTASFPHWNAVGPTYQTDLRKGMVDAIKAAEAAGYRIAKP